MSWSILTRCQRQPAGQDALGTSNAFRRSTLDSAPASSRSIVRSIVSAGGVQAFENDAGASAPLTDALDSLRNRKLTLPERPPFHPEPHQVRKACDRHVLHVQIDGQRREDVGHGGQALAGTEGVGGVEADPSMRGVGIFDDAAQDGSRERGRDSRVRASHPQRPAQAWRFESAR